MLTKKQKEVFVYIRDFLRENGHAPSLEEIKMHFKLASPSTADYYVKNLVSKGYLSRYPGKSRALKVIKDLNELNSERPNLKSRVVVPLIGYANAGEALRVADEEVEGYIEAPVLVGNSAKLFALRLDGDSMNEAVLNGKKLSDGSIVFVDAEQSSASSGDIVLVVINGHATVKRFGYDSKLGMVKLEPVSTNTSHKPIFLSQSDDVQVNGKVVAVL